MARRGVPRTLAELEGHDLVSLSSEKRATRQRARVVGDDKGFVRALVRAGGGIGLLPAHLADEDVLAGRLVRVVPTFEGTSGSIHLVMPSRRHVPSRVTAFRDLVLEHLRRRPT